MLGYCLGGTLAVIHAAARPEHVASLLLLAAPVSFADDGLLASWTKSPEFEAAALAEGFGNIPWQLMQAAFHMLRPTLNLAKTVGVIDRAANDAFLEGFLAVETWGNDNVSFPGECYARYIGELYQKDALVNGTFTLSGQPVRLEDVRCPLLSITFEHDNIVPKESAAPLLARAGSTAKEGLHLPGGHVGAVVSRAAAKRLWPQIAAFWEKHEPKRAVRARRQVGSTR